MMKDINIKIEYMDINELTPYINNAKLHPDEQIDQIVASIKEFGFNDPIAIDKNNVIIEGHGRLLACKKAGIKTVPVIRLDHLTEAQKKAYILAHNKITMNSGFDEELLKVELEALEEMDVDLELTGFSDDELDEILDEIKIAVEELKIGNPTLVNFSGLKNEERLWAMHFINGAVFALDGSAGKIADNVFLFTLKNVSVQE
jgi:ParB-like chromosome segregation protein Spo0J